MNKQEKRDKKIKKHLNKILKLINWNDRVDGQLEARAVHDGIETTVHFAFPSKVEYVKGGI